jgi:hypothetical protein
MKKIFSILAAAVIALSFASCENNGGGTVVQNGFKITVDSIEATSAHANVTPTDTAMYYGVVLYKTQDVAKVDTLVAYLGEYVEELGALMTKYGVTLADLANYGYVFHGVFDQSVSGLPSATEYTFVAFEIKEAANTVALGKYASVKFRTKELKPEKTVAMNISSAEYYYYEDYGMVQLILEDTQAGLTMGLVLEVENMNGTFTEDNFYSDGEYVYNYVEWGKGDNDWTALEKFQMTGSFDSAKKEYTVSGKAIGENMVEYTFNAKATEAVVDANAPAKQAAKHVALKEAQPIKATKAIFSSIEK